MRLLIDTNVASLANEPNPDDDLLDCQEECINRLQQVTAGKHTLVIDTDGEIVEEYFSNLNPYRPRGTGDAFAKWVFDHQHGDDCHRVEIRRVPQGSDGRVWYEELPEEATFIDASDRKFIAAAIKHGKRVPILEAIDSKWWDWIKPLAAHGVRIEPICPAYLKMKWEKKMGHKKKGD